MGFSGTDFELSQGLELRAWDKSGKWWIGTNSGDGQGILEDYSADGYRVDEFRSASMQMRRRHFSSCLGVGFSL